MRKLSVTLAAAAAILMVSSLAWKAEAAPTITPAIPNAVKNFSPIHEAACRGYGRWCGPGFVRTCGPYRCWCRRCW